MKIKCDKIVNFVDQIVVKFFDFEKLACDIFLKEEISNLGSGKDLLEPEIDPAEFEAGKSIIEPPNFIKLLHSLEHIISEDQNKSTREEIATFWKKELLKQKFKESISDQITSQFSMDLWNVVRLNAEDKSYDLQAK